MKDIKILAIIVGVITDVGSTQVILLKFIFLCAVVMRIQGQDIPSLLLHPPLSIEIPQMILGALGSFLGGFVTGRMAGTAEIKNTLLMGLLSNCTAALLPGVAATWVLAWGSVMTFAAAALGGYLALTIRREDRQAN